MLEVSSDANDDYLTYLRSHKISPAIENTTPDLSAIIKDVRKILDLFDEELAELNSPREFFTQDYYLGPSYLVEGGVTHKKKPQDDVDMTPLLAQPPSQYLPQVDAPYAPGSPPSGS